MVSTVRALAKRLSLMGTPKNEKEAMTKKRRKVRQTDRDDANLSVNRERVRSAVSDLRRREVKAGFHQRFVLLHESTIKEIDSLYKGCGFRSKADFIRELVLEGLEAGAIERIRSRHESNSRPHPWRVKAGPKKYRNLL